MAMTREEFDRQVRLVEEGVGKDPKLLKARLLRLALTGYAGLLAGLVVVVVLTLIFFVAAFFVSLEGKILFGIVGTLVLLGGGWAVLKVLLVRLSSPAGREVTNAEAPNLFAFLETLRGELRSAPFHKVLISAACNASVVQVPRLGVLGWPRNYLILGLPLMEGLSPDEFKAVLAHEFAHLSRDHGRFSHWIYRLRRSWEQVFEKLSRPRMEGEVSIRPFIKKFVEWFWPRFNAHAFVLSRANEYEADSVAARLAGEKNMAAALLRLEIHSRHLDEKFWPDLWLIANREPTPPQGVFLKLRDAFRHTVTTSDQTKWIDEALRTTTTNADTHPCLTDRLRALQALSENPAANLLTPTNVTANAAETFLGASLEAVRLSVEEKWRKDCETNWKNRHAKASSLEDRLARIDQSAATPAGDVDSLWDKARVTIDLHGDEAAEPLLRQILSIQAKHVEANFHLGRHLLNLRKSEGEAYLEAAMRGNEQCVGDACNLLRDHFRSVGNTTRLREIELRMDRHEQSLAASYAERSSVTAADTLIPHDLPEAELEPLLKILAGEPDLATAALARKELRHFPEQRLFLLCINTRPGWHGLRNADQQRAIVNRLSLSVHLPGRVFVFAPTGSFRALARKLQNANNTGIYDSKIPFNRGATSP